MVADKPRQSDPTNLYSENATENENSPKMTGIRQSIDTENVATTPVRGSDSVN